MLAEEVNSKFDLWFFRVIRTKAGGDLHFLQEVRMVSLVGLISCMRVVCVFGVCLRVRLGWCFLDVSSLRFFFSCIGMCLCLVLQYMYLYIYICACVCVCINICVC